MTIKQVAKDTVTEIATKWRFRAWFDWCQTTFGEVSAGNFRERALRVMEEAVELAQAEGVPEDVAHKVITRCYSRPEGDPHQEVGQIMLTLGVYCHLTGINPLVEADLDFSRMLKKLSEDPDYFKKRIQAKIEAGIEISGSGGVHVE